jgi:hypothetical protein
MCRNRQYTERGIKEIDGFMSECWRIEPGYFTKLDPPLGILGMLLEPITVVSVPLRAARDVMPFRIALWARTRIRLRSAEGRMARDE